MFQNQKPLSDEQQLIQVQFFIVHSQHWSHKPIKISLYTA